MIFFARVLPFAAALLGALWLVPVSTAWQLAPDLGHAWAVPVLMAYLWWERWAERPSLGVAGGQVLSESTGRRVGSALLIFAVAAVELPLRLLLTPFPLWPALLALFTVLFAGVTLAGAWSVAGRQGIRWIAGPLLLVVSALPIPSVAENLVILPLRTLMASVAAEVSNLAGHPALALGTSVRLGGGWVGIDEACGGIRSLQACIMIGLFFGEWYRFGWRKRSILLVTAVGSALLGNFARVLFLSLLTNSSSHAVEEAHDAAGWFAMALSLLLTGWLACRWAGYRWPERQIRSSPSGSTAAGARFSFSSSVGWIAPIVLLFAANEVATRIWFARGERQQTSVPRWAATLPTHDPSFQPQPLAEVAREMLRPDTFTAGRWRAAPDVFVSGYYIEWRRGQVARSVPFLHNPTVCLPLAGCELVATLPPITIPSAAGNIPFHVFKFRRAGQEMLVAFTIWDPARGQPLENTAQLSSWREGWRAQWAEVAEARQHQPAQLLTLTVPWSDAASILCRNVLENLVRSRPQPD